MSLNWDISNVENYQDKKKDPEVGQWLDGLIWGTMAVDMGSITKENWKEFLARLHTLATVFNMPVWANGKNNEVNLPTPEQVKAWIGMHTNVSTKTRKQWLKRMCEIVDRRMDDYIHVVKTNEKEKEAVESK